MSAIRLACAATLSRLFHLALGFYPAAVRGEYAGEMEAVFTLKARDAAHQSAWALILLALREAHDLPSAVGSAHMKHWRGDMNRYFPTATERVPWAAALISLVPLFVAGPVRVILNYDPGFDPSGHSWLYAAYLALSALLLLVGWAWGAIKKSPRWSYVYGVSLAFNLSHLLIYLASFYDLRLGDGFLLGLLILVPILALLCVPGFRAFYANIRLDWTQASYALYGLVLFFLATIDKDETPRLSLVVLLPSLLSLCGAMAYLRVRQGVLRLAALLAATLAGLFFFWLPIFFGMVTWQAGLGMGLFLVMVSWVILSGILLSPLLVIQLGRLLKKPA